MIKSWMIKVLVMVLAVVAGLALLANWDGLRERAQHPRGLTLRSASQPVQTWAGAISPELMGRMGGMRPHMCPHEDGDPLAMLVGHLVPCVWQNPRTRKLYYVSSVEYLD